MLKIQEKDVVSFKQIARMSEVALHRTLRSVLSKKYGRDKVVNDKDYLYAVGDIPIVLVAHMDTVFKTQPVDIFYDEQQGVMWSPQGLGADDRAGIFSILKIISDGYRPHVVFTQGEEIGGVGATALSKIECPFKNAKYMIELDRRGANDCVFYGCDNDEFNDYIESFGFVTAYGSYSDISDIAPEWNLAAVNLSIGYKDEHYVTELLYLRHMFATISKVEKMLENVPKEAFVFIPSADYYFCYCGKCHKPVEYYETIPVHDGKNVTHFLCPDCLSSVDWCNICYEAFEKGVLDKDGICPSCKKAGYKNYGDYREHYGKRFD